MVTVSSISFILHDSCNVQSLPYSLCFHIWTVDSAASFLGLTRHKNRIYFIYLFICWGHCYWTQMIHVNCPTFTSFTLTQDGTLLCMFLVETGAHKQAQGVQIWSTIYCGFVPPSLLHTALYTGNCHLISLLFFNISEFSFSFLTKHHLVLVKIKSNGYFFVLITENVK